VVSSAGSNQKDVIGSVFLVQSPTRSAEYLNNAVNQFLLDATESVEVMSDQEFLVQTQVLRQGLQVRETNLGDQFTREWGEIKSQRYEFERVDRALEVLETITKEHLAFHFK
jgi:secreted Zn-dependent insulinase-like peptidase